MNSTACRRNGGHGVGLRSVEGNEEARSTITAEHLADLDSRESAAVDGSGERKGRGTQEGRHLSVLRYMILIHFSFSKGTGQ